MRVDSDHELHLGGDGNGPPCVVGSLGSDLNMGGPAHEDVAARTEDTSGGSGEIFDSELQDVAETTAMAQAGGDDRVALP